jgi:Tfp pilus assembly protein PilN
MKYRVSLLPEKNRKRLVGKKKAEKGRGITNIVMLILLAAVLISLLGKVYADAKLNEIKDMNAAYEQKVSQLQQYREINNTLQNKIKLIENIQVNEPQLYNFVATLGNIKHPGVSLTNISCVDWKTSRVCTLTGTADSRASFVEYLEKLEAIENVKSADCTSYTVTLTDGVPVATFSITITCSGGSAVVTQATTAATTEATTN